MFCRKHATQSDERSRAVRAAAFESTAAFLIWHQSHGRAVVGRHCARRTTRDSCCRCVPCTPTTRPLNRLPVARGIARYLRFLVVTASGAVASQLLVTVAVLTIRTACTLRSRARRCRGAAAALTSVALRKLARWLDEHFQPRSCVGHRSSRRCTLIRMTSLRLRRKTATLLPIDLFASAGFDMANGANATNAYTRRHVFARAVAVAHSHRRSAYFGARKRVRQRCGAQWMER